MMNFFGKQSNDSKDPINARLRAIEWKVNIILAVMATQLTLTVLMFTKDLIVPSTSTIVIGSILLAVGLWLFRKPLISMIKRLIARQFLGDDAVPKPEPSSERDASIR